MIRVESNLKRRQRLEESHFDGVAKPARRASYVSQLHVTHVISERTEQRMTSGERHFLMGLSAAIFLMFRTKAGE